MHTQTLLKTGNRTFYTIQKEVRSMQKQPSCKTGAALKKKTVKSKVAAKKWLQKF